MDRMATTARPLWRRRAWLARCTAGGMAALCGSVRATQTGAAAQVEVWKSPNCGCCGDWIRHLQASGFQVKVHDVPDTTPVRARLGVAARYGSCHSARVGTYAIEGHVPAREIRRLMQERPDALGLAVPGMPVGSPGMDGPVYQGRTQPYDVMLLDRSGGAGVFARYR